MSDNLKNNKRIARNTAFLYIRMAVVLVISLYTSRVILNTLGVDDYGGYTVVAGFVSMFGFLNATLSSSMQRYYNFEGTKRGEEGYTEVYVTGFIIHIVLCAVIFLGNGWNLVCKQCDGSARWEIVCSKRHLPSLYNIYATCYYGDSIYRSHNGI